MYENSTYTYYISTLFQREILDNEITLISREMKASLFLNSTLLLYFVLFN